MLLAAACCSTFAPDRDSRVLVLCRCLPPDMVTAYFAPVFFSFCSGIFFFQINQNQPWNFMKQAFKQQQRDSVGTVSEGGCIISAVAARSDSRVMVMLPHLYCIQWNELSRRNFVAWFFTSCTTLSGIIKTGSVFMSTPKRLLHFSTLVRVRRVTSRGVFCHLHSAFSSMFFFNQSQAWIYMKQTKTTARLVCTCDTCAHAYSILRVNIFPGMICTRTTLQQCCCM